MLPLPMPEFWAMLLSAWFAAAAFGLWLHMLDKVRQGDAVIAVGWWMFGGVPVAAGLLASRLLAPLADNPPPLTGPMLASVLAALVAGSCGALALARATPARPSVTIALLETLLLMAGVGLATGLLSGQMPTGGGAAEVKAPAAAFLVALALASAARLIAVGSPPRRASSTPAADWRQREPDAPQGLVRRFALASVLFACGLFAADMLRMSSSLAIISRSAGMGVPGLSVLAACTFALLIGWGATLVDVRTWKRTRDLARSLGEANTRLRDLAMRDALTRLPNRLFFEERLTEAVERAERGGPSLAVMFLDLDGFKPINDSFGHVVGDDVLREVGRRLQSQARSTDTVARVGGDEFLMLVEGVGSEAQVGALAQRLLRLLGEPYALPNGLQFELACSVGVALYPQHGPQAKLMANADAAMYAAKASGGGTIAFFEPRMELDALAQLQLQHELRLALERSELRLYYQPKIDGHTGQVTGVEALVRWQHPVRGLIEPSQFIPVAERFGLIGALGHWVIEEACSQLREWLERGLRMKVSLNLSMHQLRQDDLPTRIRMAVERHRIDASLLTFEITESVAMEDTQATLRTFAHLARIGSILSIDDFGTGYSSLAYLRKLPAQQLKIDRSFVADLGHSGDALAVVDAVIKLAHALGLRVVAEGVETERQRQILLQLRCDELQGFLFAKPMPAHMLTLWAQGDEEQETVPAQMAWPAARTRVP